MTLCNRLAKLELTRPKPGADGLELDLPPDLCARMDAEMAAGTWPEGLSDDDQMLIVHALDKARGWA